MYEINHAFATWASFTGLLKSLAYAPDATCPWRALGLDPATAATATTELLDDRTNRIRLMLDEAEHWMKHNEADNQRIQEARNHVSGWYDSCKEEMPEVQALARRRGQRSSISTYLEPPSGP